MPDGGPVAKRRKADDIPRIAKQSVWADALMKAILLD